jgi:hypothetical protein
MNFLGSNNDDDETQHKVVELVGNYEDLLARLNRTAELRRYNSNLTVINEIVESQTSESVP